MQCHSVYNTILVAMLWLLYGTPALYIVRFGALSCAIKAWSGSHLDAMKTYKIFTTDASL